MNFHDTVGKEFPNVADYLQENNVVGFPLGGWYRWLFARLPLAGCTVMVDVCMYIYMYNCTQMPYFLFNPSHDIVFFEMLL